MKVATADGVYDNFAIYLEITDEQLNAIKENPGLVKDEKFMVECVKSKGDNIHIIQITFEGRENMLRGSNGFFRGYKSVSWVHNNKFFNRGQR